MIFFILISKCFNFERYCGIIVAKEQSCSKSERNAFAKFKVALTTKTDTLLWVGGAWYFVISFWWINASFTEVLSSLQNSKLHHHYVAFKFFVFNQFVPSTET